MTALHREHRTQEALEVYAEARAVMADELGIEPGEALQRIEAAILLDDPARDPDLGDHPMPRAAARLPVPRTPTYGRDDLVDSVVRSLEDPDTRLVTLTGLGGSGKTRVATVAAARVRDEPDGTVHFHEVTERETADDVVAAVEAMVGEPDPGPAAEDRPLVVLDNVDACADGSEAVSRILDDLPRCRSWSPAAYRCGGAPSRPSPSRRWPCRRPTPRRPRSRRAPRSSCSCASPTRPTGPSTLDGREGAWRRCAGCWTASPWRSSSRPPASGSSVSRACARASSRDSELLRTTAPDVPERQRVLASTIAWSHDRLGEGARQLCRRLVVFEQAFTLEAVEAVAADAGDVIELLTQVMETGLIRPLIGRIRIGFVMPATVRTFVRRLVPDPRENDPARLALAAYLLDHVGPLAGRPRPGRGPARAGALPRRGRRRARVGRGGAAARPDRGGGGAHPGVRAVLGAPPASCVPASPAPATPCASSPATPSRPAGCTRWPASWPTTSTTTPTRWPPSSGPSRSPSRCGDEATVATSRCFYASALLVNNEVERGTELARLGAEAAARLGLYPLVAEALSVLAIAHAVAGDFDAEREMHLARLAVAREHGDVARTADALTILAEIALDEADARDGPCLRRGGARHRPPLPADGGARRADHPGPRRDRRREPARRGAHARAGARGRREDRPEARGRAVLPRGRLPRGRAGPGRRGRAAVRRRAADRALARAAPTSRSRATSPAGSRPPARPWGRRRSRASGPSAPRSRSARVRELLSEVVAAVPV